MMMSAIMRELMAAGVEGEALVAAIERIEASTQSTDNPPTSADETAEKRRAKDRERQRIIRGVHRQSTDNPPTPENALILSPLEKKEVAKQKERKIKKRSCPIPEGWQPNQAHRQAAQKLNLPPGFVDRKAEDMRFWAQSSGALKADWDATFHGFLRRDAENLPKSSDPQQEWLSAIR